MKSKNIPRYHAVKILRDQNWSLKLIAQALEVQKAQVQQYIRNLDQAPLPELNTNKNNIVLCKKK